MEEKDQGFTLIELLVVIIIIGILAAIAIPVFLNQRKKGWDAQAKSDLKNMATAEETYLTDNGVYTVATSSALTPLTNAGFKSSADVTGHTAAVFTGGNGGASAGYCLQVTSKSGTTWYANSEASAPTSTVPTASKC